MSLRNAGSVKDHSIFNSYLAGQQVEVMYQIFKARLVEDLELLAQGPGGIPIIVDTAPQEIKNENY